MSFQSWMKRVNEKCVEITGLTTLDFEDYRWRDAYEDELLPEQALEDFFHETGLVRQYPEVFDGAL